MNRGQRIRCWNRNSSPVADRLVTDVIRSNQFGSFWVHLYISVDFVDLFMAYVKDASLSMKLNKKSLFSGKINIEGNFYIYVVESLNNATA